jgi:predicted NBD/HSP70 family sugar kinase
MAMKLDANERLILRLIWQRRALSRWELHELTSSTPNQVGLDAGRLVKRGLLRERIPDITGPGRPRVPLEIDPSRRYVLGLALRPGHIECARLNLLGAMLGRQIRVDIAVPDRMIPSACELVKAHVGPDCIGVGLSTPGFVDLDQRQILSSSAMAGKVPVALAPVYSASGAIPVTLENDMHALAARWLMTHEAFGKEDVVLVFIQDGELGAAVLIDGQPNRGCAVGANDLGHMRVMVRTELCHCGHYGCLERICSTAFLRNLDGNGESLLNRLASIRTLSTDPSLKKMTRYLATGLANAANFMRPNRLVLVSQFIRYPVFSDALTRFVRRRLLAGIADRIQIDLWDQPGASNGETAGWLALASLYRDGWNRMPSPPEQ